jgi:hypothetical protein
MRWSVEESIVIASSIAPMVYLTVGDYATGFGLLSVPILGYLIVKYQDDIRANKVLMTFLRKIL